MKKIIFILSFAAFGLVSFGQAATVPMGVGTKLNVAFPIINLAIDSLNEQIAYNGNMRIGLYNILDYGATNTGTVEDQTSINAAITAANAIGTASPYMGGTVIIPAGKWYLTGPITLKSNVTIKIEENALFTFPAGYADNVFVNDTTTRLERCYVSGGRWYNNSRTYTFAKLVSSQSSKPVQMNAFSNMWIENANIVFDVVTYHDGWINSNVFDRIIGYRPVSFYKSVQTDAYSMGIDGNLFSNCQVQAASGVTQYAIENLTGNYNMFTNLMLWDFDGATDVTLSADSYYNYICASNITKSRFTNLGNYNLVINKGSVLSTGNKSFFDADDDITYLGDDKFNVEGGRFDYPYKVNIWGAATVKDTVDKLVVSHYGSTGSIATPAGDVAIKLKSIQTSASVVNSANFSARIVARNSGATDYGSYLYLQTHGPSSAETYNTAMSLMANKGVVYPPVSSGTVSTSILSDIQGRIIYYNEAAATDLTADPQIVDGYDGQIITIIGSSDTNTLTLDNGTGLSLKSAQIVLGIGDSVTLAYIAALDLWIEL